MSDIVIDTSILYECANINGTAIYLLENYIRKNIFICFDFEEKILSEYKKCFIKIKKAKSPGEKFLQKWFSKISSKLIKQYSGNLTQKQKQDLKDLSFHNDDYVFVGVAIKSISKIIISEDSDYNESVKNYLSKVLNILVDNIESAAKKTS